MCARARGRTLPLRFAIAIIQPSNSFSNSFRWQLNQVQQRWPYARPPSYLPRACKGPRSGVGNIDGQFMPLLTCVALRLFRASASVGVVRLGITYSVSAWQLRLAGITVPIGRTSTPCATSHDAASLPATSDTVAVLRTVGREEGWMAIVQ